MLSFDREASHKQFGIMNTDVYGLFGLTGQC